MDATNGVEVMLRAIARLRGAHYRFVFAGGGPLADAVRRAADGDGRIAHPGFLKLSDLLPIYKQADVLVNMRLTKAIRTRYFFPSKLMEFLASGTPVISTCPGHVEEEFGAFLFLLKDETPEGLAAAIRHAETAGGKARREMGQRARAYMLAHKTWASQAARIGAMLQDLAGAAAESSTSCG
jgi:glycosyltransferase involved in cell wall biosynthesis